LLILLPIALVLADCYLQDGSFEKLEKFLYLENPTFVFIFFFVGSAV